MAGVLKGGISNIKYIWHSSENACKECQALDGKEYDFEEDIPDKPHPNCQCWIEEKEDEPCECEEYFAQIEETIGEGREMGRMYTDDVCGEMLKYKIPEDLRK